MSPGISTSASSISLRPKSASERSATLKSPSDVESSRELVFVIKTPQAFGVASPPERRQEPELAEATRYGGGARRGRTHLLGVGPDHRMTARDEPDRREVTS